MDSNGFKQGFDYIRNVVLVGILLLLVIVGVIGYGIGKGIAKKENKTELAPVDNVITDNTDVEDDYK